MNSQIAENSHLTSGKQLWPEALLIISLIAGLSSYVIFFTLDAGNTVENFNNEFISHQLSYKAHILLLASGLFYIILLWNNSSIIGRWATGLAVAGIIITGVAFVTHVYESNKLLQMGQVPVSNLYELSLFFTLLTVSIYLIMEQLFQSRSAGAFIAPIIFSAIGLQLWLESSDLTSSLGLNTTLQYYWVQSNLLARLIGFGALAVSAATAAMYLIRQRAEQRGEINNSIAQHFPSLEFINNWTYCSIAAGLPIFALAAIIAPAIGYFTGNMQSIWTAYEVWSIIVILSYGFFLQIHYIKHYSNKTMAWLSIFCFLVSSSCFFIINFFF